MSVHFTPEKQQKIELNKNGYIGCMHIVEIDHRALYTTLVFCSVFKTWAVNTSSSFHVATIIFPLNYYMAQIKPFKFIYAMNNRQHTLLLYKKQHNVL